MFALVLISPFINVVDDGRESMFIECPGDTMGAISTSEGRIRILSYLEELKKQSGKQ